MMSKPHSPKPLSFEQTLDLPRVPLSSVASLLGAAAVFLLPVLLLPTAARALECGEFTFPKCSGNDVQYAGGFEPKVGHGGFGGGACTATKTPVVFIHGNGDRAINWASPVVGAVEGYVPPKRSVYDEFKRRGYNDCELFGLTYLTPDEQENPGGNYHRPEKYVIIHDFINAVKAYTGKDKVDLVTHSLGVSMTLAALKHHDAWQNVRRFVNIAGGIKGLNSCFFVGPANPLATTCGSESFLEADVFGFYPDSMFAPNGWTGSSSSHSLRHAPRNHPDVSFYTVHAGQNDEIHCTTVQGWDDCGKGALFEKTPNVKAQMNLGAGSRASQVDWNLSDGSPWNQMGGDTDGVGHFKAKNNSGQILYTILNTECEGLACKGDYTGGPVKDRDDAPTSDTQAAVGISIRD
jgi:pimeloyl-ACP methyl ester carboxylesterase